MSEPVTAVPLHPDPRLRPTVYCPSQRVHQCPLFNAPGGPR